VKPSSASSSTSPKPARWSSPTSGGWSTRCSNSVTRSCARWWSREPTWCSSRGPRRSPSWCRWPCAADSPGSRWWGRTSTMSSASPTSRTSW